MYRLGIDIGGTKVNIVILKDNTVLAKEKFIIHSLDNFLSEIVTYVKSLCDKNSLSFSDFICCGMGVPGTISEDGRVAVLVPNLKIANMPLAEEFEKATGIPSGLIKDSNAAAWGEYKLGSGKGCDNLFCITLGTGLGTGIIMDGKIYSGALNRAGELGHVPVVKDGRECGCGKKGCLEKYAAGKGLEITAKEMYGDDATTPLLFEKAKQGDGKAIDAISNAVELLSRTITTAINLMSPDCVLFSGGLSGEEELFLMPLIEKINNSIYRTSDESIKIAKASLGEDSPAIGAALIPDVSIKREPKISASIMCADMMNLEKAFKELEESGIDYIHSDIMDGHFVPNYMLSPELLNKMRAYCSLPFDFHIMAENPENVIEMLKLQEGDYVSVHVESTNHLQRALHLVREKGGKAAVALNPATPIEFIIEVLDDIDMVLIMSVNPGFAGQKIVPSSFDKLRRTRQYLDSHGLHQVPIQVDGNCSFENVPKMYDSGADIFVVGTSSVFNGKDTIANNTRKLLDTIKQ